MAKKIKILNSEMEAMVVREILEKNEIPHIIRSYHDSVYDGIFQNQLGWGALEADGKDEARILELLKDINPDQEEQENKE